MQTVARQPRAAYDSRQGLAARLAAVLPLLGISLLALALRWDRIEYAEFGIDQAWSTSRAYDLVTRGDFPLVGIQSSVCLPQGATEIYLLALPMAVDKNPVVATAFMGLLQTIAVAVTYLFARKYFGRLEGIAAALLFAVNPWALHYGRKIWTQDLLPLFTILFFVSLFVALVERRRSGLVLAFFFLSVMFFLHPQAVGFAPVLAIACALGARRLGYRPMVLGACLATVVALPYLLHDYQNGFANVRSLVAVATTGESVVSLDSVRYVVSMASAAGFPQLLDHSFRAPVTYPDLRLPDALATVLLSLGAALCAWRVGFHYLGRQRAQSAGFEKHLLVLLWVAVPVLLMVRHPLLHYPHYYVYVLPGQYVAIGLALGWVTRRAASLGPWLRLPPRALASAAFICLLLSLSVPQAALFQTYLGYVADIGPRRPYGTPLVYSQRAVSTIRELRTALGDPDIYVYASIHRFALDYLARPDLTLRHVDPPRELVLPRAPGNGYLAVLGADDAILAVNDFHATDDAGPLIPRLRELGFTELAERAVRGPDGFAYFRFFYLPPEESRRLLARYTRPARSLDLPHGMRLAGYALSPVTRPGGRVVLSLLWDLPRDHTLFPYGEYNVFVHALDGFAAMVAQRDWELVQYMGWHITDFVVTRHELEVPPDYPGPDLIWLDFGVYERYGRQVVPARASASGQSSEAIKVGPVKVVPSEPGPAPEVATAHRFGDWFEMEGFDLQTGTAKAGSDFAVRLHWRALAKPALDCVVSLQLLDSEGRLVAQHDSPPLGGTYHTSYWSADERVMDVRSLQLPAELRPGRYELTVVVYTAQGQRRLLVGGTDSARLGSIEVQR